ncbi:MAG: hypothetical protein D6719_04820 [Candidatus Dadabacteria bacterium]|nr:MAG: hypothetical protein D6719_04820 [Candidatus Dadabacteria bacterium]
MTKDDSYQNYPGFIEAILGLFFEPGSIIERLLSVDRPRYAATILLCLFVTIFAPPIAQQIKYGTTVYRPEAILSIFIAIFFFILIFSLLEGLFLQIIGVEFEFRQLLAAIAYALTPLMLAIWLVYAFNYWASGSLSLVSYLVTGSLNIDDHFLRIIPAAFTVAVLWVLLLFYYSVRVIGDMHPLNAALVTILSVVPAFLSFWMGLLLGDLARPGTVEIFLNILVSPSSLTLYGH